MKKLAILTVLLILILPSVYSLTAAIGNARAVINVEASPEDPAIIDRTLKVINKNDVPVIVSFYPDATLRNMVELIDNDFTLQPGEEKNAAFILTVDRGGTIEGSINVLFSPEDPESKETDVGLASRLIIISDGPIIEEPEEQQQPEEETTENTPEEEETQEEEVPTQTGEENEEEENNQPIITNKPTSKTETGANPLVGLGIMALVLVVGLGVFFGVMKVMKK